MSATLTWYHTGLGAKTGTTAATLFADIVSLAGTVAGDANFKWEVKGSNTGSTPYYISFGRKDGSAGRIALIMWTSSPAGNNSAILDTTPSSNQLYIAWFPAGTGTTLANLAASSGAITGDDTDCVKVSCSAALSALYQASYQPFYFDSAEAMVFGFQNPASTTCYCLGAGDVIVDAADAAYGATFGYLNSVANFGTTTTLSSWTATALLAGSNGASALRTNYGAANRVYYHAFLPAGSWAGQNTTNSPMINTTTKDIYFAPVHLLGTPQGQFTRLKFRQIGWGPGATSAFKNYEETGPVTFARQFNGATSGGDGYPWFTNFKI